MVRLIVFRSLVALGLLFTLLAPIETLAQSGSAGQDATPIDSEPVISLPTATTIPAEPTQTVTATATATMPSLDPQPTATEPSISALVVVPKLTINNSSGPVSLEPGDEAIFFAVGLDASAAAALDRFDTAGCTGNLLDSQPVSTDEFGNMTLELTLNEIGSFWYQAHSGDVVTDCVGVTVSIPDLPNPVLSINNSSTSLAVAPGSALVASATGLLPNSVASFGAFSDSSCTDDGDWTDDLAVDGSGSLIHTIGVLPHGFYSYQVSAESGDSNCVAVQVGDFPRLTVNQQTGSVTVEPHASFLIAVTGLDAAGSATIRRFTNATCDSDNSTDVSTVTADAGGGAIFTDTILSQGDFSYLADIPDFGTGNCVTVIVDDPSPPVISLHGHTVLATTDSLTVIIHGSNFQGGTNTVTVHQFAGTDCSGDPIANGTAQLPSVSGALDYSATVTSPPAFPFTYSYQAEQNYRVSNCLKIMYDSASADVPNLLLTANGQGSVLVPSGTSVELYVTGLTTSGMHALKFYSSSSECQEDSNSGYEVGPLPPAGASYSHDVQQTVLSGETTRWYRAWQEAGETGYEDDDYSACVDVTWEAVYALPPHVTVNNDPGYPDPVIVAPGEEFTVVVTGLGDSDGTKGYTQGCSLASTGSFAIIHEDDIVDGTYSFTTSLTDPGTTTYFWASATSGPSVLSNCVAVTVEAIPPVLSVNNNPVGPVEVAADTPFVVFATNLPDGSGRFELFQNASCTGSAFSSEGYTAEAGGSAAITTSPSEGFSGSYRAAPDVGSLYNSNCVAVTVTGAPISPPPVLSANNNPGPLTVDAGDHVSLFATGLPLTAETTISQYPDADCSGTVEWSDTGTSTSSGTFNATRTFWFGTTVWFRIESGGVSTNCVEVTINPPTNPVLTVNNSQGPLTVTTGDALTLLVTGLPEELGVTAAAVPVTVAQFTGNGCSGSGEVVASGVSTDDGAFQTAITIDDPGTYSLVAGTTDLTANCVDLTVQAAATATATATIPVVQSSPTPIVTATMTSTPTSTTTWSSPTSVAATSTPTSTPRQVLPGHTTAPLDPTSTPGDGNVSGGVTQLPSTGATSPAASGSWLVFGMLLAMMCLALAAVQMRRRR